MGKFSMSRFFGMDDNYEADAETYPRTLSNRLPINHWRIVFINIMMIIKWCR